MSGGSKEEIRFKGIPASPGIAQAPAVQFLKRQFDVPMYIVSLEAIPGELKRFEDALVETRRQIQRIRSDIAQSLGEDEARIFDAHLMVLEDMALIGETQSEVKRSSFNVEHCFHQVAQKYIEFFDSIDDEYLKERVNDIRDVTRRLLIVLLGYGDAANARLAAIAVGKILVAKDLTPSDTASLHTGGVLGVITDTGGVTSHTAIMARSLGVPAIVGLHNAFEQITNDDHLLIDAYEGVVIVNPSKATIEQYTEYRLRKETVARLFTSEAAQPGRSLDNCGVPLSINIEGVRDIENTRHMNVDGVGLFRTESIFLSNNRIVSEEQQFHEYKAVVEAMGGRMTVFRTFDLGGDKLLPSDVFSTKESNPFMGLRAIRYCLKFPEVFKTQLRAILRASHFGNLKIMFPMISGLGELLEANSILEGVKRQLDAEGIPYRKDIEVGTMIEVPSAAATVDLIADYCSFVSIGTNDLIQYMLAVDRVNDMISDLYEPCHPAVIRTIRHIVTGAHAKGIPVSVCGEMAGDPVYAPLLLGLGVDELSVAPSVYPEIRYLIRHLSVASAKTMAEEALKHSNPVKIYRILKEFYLQVFRDIL